MIKIKKFRGDEEKIICEFFLSRDEKEAATAADDEFVRLSSLQVSFKEPTSAELLNYFISLVRCFSLQFTIFFLSLHSSASIFNVTIKSRRVDLLPKRLKF